MYQHYQNRFCKKKIGNINNNFLAFIIFIDLLTYKFIHDKSLFLSVFNFSLNNLFQRIL